MEVLQYDKTNFNKANGFSYSFITCVGWHKL